MKIAYLHWWSGLLAAAAQRALAASLLELPLADDLLCDEAPAQGDLLADAHFNTLVEVSRLGC